MSVIYHKSGYQEDTDFVYMLLLLLLPAEELIEAIKNDIKFAEEKLYNVSLSQDEIDFFNKTEESLL